MQRTTSQSPLKLHPGTGVSPQKQVPKTLPAIERSSPAIIHWDGPCECKGARELCEQCKAAPHPFADNARSVHAVGSGGSPGPRGSPSLAASPAGPAIGASSPGKGLDGRVAFGPFHAEILKLNGAVEQAEEKLQTNVTNRFVEKRCTLIDKACAPSLGLEERQRLIEKNGADCVKLLRQREAASSRVRKRASAQVVKLVEQFASELATAANAALEHEHTSGLTQRDTISKQLNYKIDNSHYDVETMVQAQVANIQALADGRVSERDGIIKTRDDTIARLERQLEAAIKLNAKLVERENLEAERLAIGRLHEAECEEETTATASTRGGV